MQPDMDVNVMAQEVRRIKSAAERLNRLGDNFPALSRNTLRILASVKMLELNIGDYVSLEADELQIAALSRDSLLIRPLKLPF